VAGAAAVGVPIAVVAFSIVVTTGSGSADLAAATAAGSVVTAAGSDDA
jgi:hypothetical protein